MKLITALSKIFGVPADHVYVFSIAQSSGSVASSPYGVDVWVAIQDSSGGFMNANRVLTELETNYMKFVALGKFLFLFNKSVYIV
jgi:hypothetical protein